MSCGSRPSAASAAVGRLPCLPPALPAAVPAGDGAALSCSARGGPVAVEGELGLFLSGPQRVPAVERRPFRPSRGALGGGGRQLVGPVRAPVVGGPGRVYSPVAGRAAPCDSAALRPDCPVLDGALPAAAVPSRRAVCAGCVRHPGCGARVRQNAVTRSPLTSSGKGEQKLRRASFISVL